MTTDTAQPAPAPSPAATTPASASGAGLALMLLGILLFALNDTLGKVLVTQYSVGQVLLLRSIAGLIVLSPVLLRQGWRPIFRPAQPGLNALRVVFTTIEVFLFYMAVKQLPLADVMTYWLAAPIYVAALSPLLLGERVGWRRWTAIVIGFGGVLVALEPSAATMTSAALISVIGSFLFGLILLTGRMLRGTPDTVLVFWHLAGSAVAGAIVAPFGWVQPSPLDFALLGLLGVVAMVAHLCVNRALKLADAAVTAPAQYTLLVWAIIFGWLVFGDVPRPAMLVGSAIIVASGLFITLRERQLGKAATVMNPPPA
ncbi:MULTISPECIES: DMT family transporter [unclassified Aureimonas]|uniref:DMT family transporter n=1 Tax=unclassified Aureimonas TaxID=2615206 RepID=UPI0006F67040|nr:MULTISPECIES: DMT family transporter [unclassified Aureimonas]KQT52569.1 multidrug DMT transporter permease [Aureimonas sp. Leaf427]KQT77530.1 multidrug DMT transporter permease [Aureimonas sp. Leaf460]